MNSFLFGFYRCSTTEKQWYKPNRLPGIAHPFELKEVCVPCLYEQKFRAALRLLSREFTRGKHDRQTIKRLRTYFCAQYLFRAVCLSLSNVIKESH